MTDITKLEFNPLQDNFSKLELLETMPHYSGYINYNNGDVLSKIDATPVLAARVSTGSGLRGYQQDVKLLKYLWEQKHSSPFEQVQLKFYVKAPIFVARQWFRHRTMSFNEISARYTELKDEFYIPKDFRTQSKTLKQSEGGVLPENQQNAAKRLVESSNSNSYRAYKELIDMGVERGLARTVLPTNIYTEFIFSVNLRNLLHFVGLRSEVNAQWEIRQYSYSIEEILAFVCPEIYILYKG
jgi:thymidylate synthase (FAD)